MNIAPRTIDEPPRIFGLTVEEFFGAGFIFIVLYLKDKPLIGILLAIVFIILFKRTTKGKDGAVIHFLYKLGLQYPGFLPSYIDHFEE